MLIKLPSEKDIYRSAKAFIYNLGDDALVEARKIHASRASAGDKMGAHIWKRIADAIEFLQTPANLNDEQCQ